MSPAADPPPSQTPASLILSAVAELTQDRVRLVKLHKSIALHRLLVVFISSNPAYYIILPCLQILESCLITPGLENFQRSFETEGGFALLARTLGPIWRSDIQTITFRIVVGPSSDRKELLCGTLVSSLLAALDILLQAAIDGEDGGSRPVHGRTRSGTVTSARSVTMSPIVSSMLLYPCGAKQTDVLPSFKSLRK